MIPIPVRTQNSTHTSRSVTCIYSGLTKEDEKMSRTDLQGNKALCFSSKYWQPFAKQLFITLAITRELEHENPHH